MSELEPNTIPGRSTHECRNGLGGSEWAASNLGIGALSRCRQCGRWWVLRGSHSGYEWMPVRWYNLGLKRKIEAAR